MSVSNYISASDVVATVDTSSQSKVLFLPGVSSIYGKILTVKDVTGNASTNPIILKTALFDKFENQSNNYTIDTAFGSVQLLAKSNYWYFLGTGNGATGGGSTGSFGISSLSSIVSYGLSSVAGQFGISSLSSIVSYGLSSFTEQIFTSSIYTNYISSGFGEFSNISTQAILVGLVDSPLQVGIGIETPFVSTIRVISDKGYFSRNIGIGIEPPYWYALDVVGDARFSGILYGDGSGLSNIDTGNLAIPPAPGVSSLSSIVSYGLSTVAAGAGGAGSSTLSSIISYGLSTVANGAGGTGTSTLSSIISYGLSSVYGGQGISSLSSIVSYGLSSVAGGQGISSLSSIVSYGLSSIAGGQGISSLSSIIAYGLSSVNEAGGISSLSSIVSYGLSSVAGAQGISSLSSIVAYGLSTVASGFGVSTLSSIVSYGLSTVARGAGGPGVSTLSSIVSYGLSSFRNEIFTSSIYTNYISSGIADFSTLSTQTILVGYVASPLQVDVGIDTPAVMTCNINAATGIITGNLGIGKQAPYWYALDVAGDAHFSGLIYGDGSALSNINIGNFALPPATGLSSLSSIVSYGLSTVRVGAINPGVSSLSSIVSYGLSTVAAGAGISTLSSIVSYGLSTVSGAAGLSSLSSIVSYGLSSMIQSSILQTTVGAFTDFGLGGLGISSLDSLPSKKPDTITNAFAKVDHWLYSNLVTQPPLPSSNIANIQGTFAQIILTPPFQFRSGALARWLPAIDAIHADVFLGTQAISTIVLSNSAYLPHGASNFQGFYFDGQASPTCNISFFGYSYGGYSNLFYVPFGSSLQLSSNYQINVYYSNTSIDPVNYFTNYWEIARGGFPSAPYDIFINNVSFSNIFVNFTLSNVDSTDSNRFIDSTEYYTNATITLSNRNTDTLPQRYNLGYISYNSIQVIPLEANLDRGSNVIYNVTTNIPADTVLYFNVATKNSLNQNNSSNSSNSAGVRTALPPAAPRLTNVTYNSGNVTTYTNAGIPLGQPRATSVSVLRYDSIVTNGGLSNSINSGGALAIHTSSTPGNSNKTPISFIQVGFGSESNTYNFYGWSNPIQSADTQNRTFSRISVNSIADVYPGQTYLSNFYLQASNVNITILSNGLTPTSNAYTYSIVHSNQGVTNISCNSPAIYVDSITGSPTLNQLTNAAPATNQIMYLNGVVSFLSNATFSFKADIGSWASNFYPATTNFITMSNSSQRSGSGLSNIDSNAIVYNTADSTTWTGTIPNPARFLFSNLTFAVLSNVVTSNSATQIVTTFTVNSLTGTTTLTSNLPYYFDVPSMALLSNFQSNANARGGQRWESFSNSYALSAASFIQSNIIVGNSCNNYNLELPLFNGLYRTGVNLGAGYSNLSLFSGVSGYTYPNNYSNISGETGIRYATFKYSFSNSRSQFAKLLQFNVNSPTGFTGASNFDSSIVTTLWYKVDNSGAYNTGWVDGNSFKNSLNAFISASDGTPGLRSNSFNTPITGVKRYFSIIPIPTACNYDVYLKVGLNMTCNASFDYITMSNVYGNQASAPTGLILSNDTNQLSNNLIGRWTNPSDLDVDTNLRAPILSNTGSFTAIALGSFPRRWVPSGTNISNDVYTFTTVGDQSNIIYYRASNADTFYTLSVAAANDVGQGTNSTVSFRTRLPPPLPAFYSNTNSLGLLPSYNITYPNNTNGPIYNTGTSRSLISRVINRTSAFGAGTIVQAQVSNGSAIQFTLNSESNTVGSNLGTVIFYATVVNGSRSDTSQYRFFNNLYSNAAVTTLTGSNGAQSYAYLSNTRDHYLNSNTFPTYTGFYYTAAATQYASNTFIVGSNIGYQFIMSNNQGSNIASPMYYFDDLASIAPTVNSIFVDTTVPSFPAYSNVSGLAVLNSTSAYDFWIVCSNLGSYYFISPPVVVTMRDSLGALINQTQYDSNISFYATANTASVMTNTVANASKQTYISWSNITPGPSIFTPLAAFTNTGVASNINDSGLAASFAIGDSNNKRLYFDYASIANRNLIRDSNSIPGYGLQVESGSGSNPDWYPACNVRYANFGFTYDDTISLVGAYSNELQMANGSYCAAGVAGSYCNYTSGPLNLYVPSGYTTGYPDYSSVSTSGGMRYATFMWYVSQDPSFFKNITYFVITGNNFPIANIGGINKYTGGITLQFRMVGNVYPPSSTGNTSAWLDGNSLAAPTRDYLITNTAGGVNSATINGTTVTSDQYNRIISLKDKNIYIGKGVFNLFIRIGLPVASNFNFNNIYLSNIITS